MAANTEVQHAVAGWPCLTPAGLRLRFTPVAPSARQAAFLALINREALYGGSAGSGKARRCSWQRSCLQMCRGTTP